VPEGFFPSKLIVIATLDIIWYNALLYEETMKEVSRIVVLDRENQP
jgi:hypothetical protein